MNTRNMMKIFIVVFFSMTVFACAPARPPYVENGKYLNPANNFSFKLPSNWELRKEVPNWLENSVCVGKPKNLQAYFINKEVKGVVQLDVDKTFLNLKKASTNYYSSTFNRSLIDGFYEGLEKSLEKQEDEMNKNRFVEDFNYRTYSNNLSNLPSKIIEAELKCNDKQELIRKKLTCYVLLCDDDDTCFVNFSLISPASDFEKAQESYISMMRTLSTWNLLIRD